MKYATEMVPGACIYIPNFIRIGSGIKKFNKVDSQTCRQQGDFISLF
jgi:hypothetical protein